MFDILIRHGLVFDGTGQDQGLKLDIGIKDQKIAEIGELADESAKETIEADGLYVAPGFIDIQNHSDSHGQILFAPAVESMTAQGVTTIVIGQCGASLADN